MYLCSYVEEHCTEFIGVRADAVMLGWHRLRDVLLLALGSDQAACLATVHRLHGWVLHVLVGWLSEDTHAHRACAMSSLVLAQVVRARELLAAVGALERLVVSVERPVVAFEMFLASEATAAERADESLGWVIRQGLLAATTGDPASLSWRWCG